MRSLNSLLDLFIWQLEAQVTAESSLPQLLLRSITLHAFADTSCTVSHGVLQQALHPHDSQPPWPHSPCMGIGSHSSCFFLDSLPISFSHLQLCYYVICPTCMCSTSSPCDYCTRMFLHLMPVPFVQHLTSIAHI